MWVSRLILALKLSGCLLLPKEPDFSMTILLVLDANAVREP